MVIKGGYYVSWVDLDPSTINPKLFTHITYAFVNPVPIRDSLNNVSFEFKIDPDQARSLEAFNKTLHETTPPMKTLFSVGGYSEGNDMLSKITSNSSSRKKFVLSSIKLARDYGFDGIDLDWVFPGTHADMDNMGRLLDEWRAEVQNEAASKGGTPLLLTASVLYTNVITFDGPRRAYPSTSLSKNLDWINIMSYDYSGWDKTKTGANAALNNPNRNGASTSAGLQSWINSGIPEGKLIMAMPLFGKTWKLANRASHGIGAPATGVGPGEDGTLTYAEIVQFNMGHNATRVYDPLTASAYSYAGDTWLGYDDTETVKMKIQYAQNLGIRGYIFWALHGDYNWEISTTASAAWPA